MASFILVGANNLFNLDKIKTIFVDNTDTTIILLYDDGTSSSLPCETKELAKTIFNGICKELTNIGVIGE